MSIRVFCTLFICLVFNGLLKSICFRMFCSKHSITFENTYLLSCWFHCVDKFYMKFRFRETFTVISSVTYWLKDSLNLELLSFDLPYTHTCPMDTYSSIRHRFDVEIPCGKFVEITSILKGESMWKLRHRFDVDISTWIRLSKSMKYRWVLQVDFSMSFDIEST